MEMLAWVNKGPGLQNPGYLENTFTPQQPLYCGDPYHTSVNSSLSRAAINL